MSAPLRNPEELRRLFEARGDSVTEWARQRGFKRETVYALLRGRSRGRRGEAHRAAVALGLKAPVPEDALRSSDPSAPSNKNSLDGRPKSEDSAMK